MSTDINNIDDLFDDEINKALVHLRQIFPKTVEDFKSIEKNDSPLIQPDNLKDPISFLGKTNRKLKPKYNPSAETDLTDYSSNFAQAAREGKTISEEIKKRMKEDKEKSSKGKNG